MLKFTSSLIVILTLFVPPRCIINIILFFSPVSQLESGGFEDICKSEYGMDAWKFSLCRHSRGGQIHRTRGRIHAMEKIRNHRCHDSHWYVLSDCFWNFGSVGELPPKNNTPCTIGQVPINTYYNYQIHFISIDLNTKFKSYQCLIKDRV